MFASNLRLVLRKKGRREKEERRQEGAIRVRRILCLLRISRVPTKINQKTFCIVIPEGIQVLFLDPTWEAVSEFSLRILRGAGRELRFIRAIHMTVRGLSTFGFPG